MIKFYVQKVKRHMYDQLLFRMKRLEKKNNLRNIFLKMLIFKDRQQTAKNESRMDTNLGTKTIQTYGF